MASRFMDIIEPVASPAHVNEHATMFESAYRALAKK
jgi:hypothetical protein